MTVNAYTYEREQHGVPVLAKVLTKAPSKYRLVDLETGEVWGIDRTGGWEPVPAKGASPYTELLRKCDDPVMALHYAINAIARRDERRYISTHVTGDALSTLERAGWRLVWRFA